MTDQEKHKLSKGLERLREELKKQEIDESSRQRLESLAARVESQLEEKSADRESHHSLVQELEQELMHLEVAHPRLTAILNDIMVALSNMGI